MKTIIIAIISLLLVSSITLAQSSNIDLEDILPALVLIQTPIGLGSGVIINIEGYILTNYHVISIYKDYPNQITVTTNDNEVFTASRIIDIDEDLDLALIRTAVIENGINIWISNPDSIKAGQDVYAIGSPAGLRNYITKGIVSKFNTPFVFTNAEINPGNSGGALVNSIGELVGIPTMKIQDMDGFGIAVCPRTIRYFLKKNNINYN